MPRCNECLPKQTATHKPLGCIAGTVRYVYGLLAGWLISSIKARIE